MLKKLLCVLLTISMVFAFCACGGSSDEADDESVTPFEEPQAVDETTVTMDDMTYDIPEGFGVLASDNEDLPGSCYQNEKGIMLDVETLSPDQFGDYDASSADGVIKEMTADAAKVEDVTIGNYKGKKFIVKEKGKVIEMGIAINVNGSVYFADFYGEDDNGNAIVIDEESQETFNQFCKNIKL